MDPITRTTRICTRPATLLRTHHVHNQLQTAAHTCTRHRADTQRDWPGRFQPTPPGQMCGHATDHRPYPQALAHHIELWLRPAYAVALPDTPDTADWSTVLQECLHAARHAGQPRVAAALIDAVHHAGCMHRDPIAARAVLLAVAAAERAIAGR